MDDIGYKDHGYSFQILVSYEWVVADTNHLQQVYYPCRIRHYVEAMQMLCHKAMQNLC